MTNEQKAVIIATRDGWVEDGGHYSKKIEIWIKYLSKIQLEDLYLTDLNYLVPVAVKVIIELEDIGMGEMARELTATMLLNISSGTYQPLFDAVFNAIVYLENQNK